MGKASSRPHREVNRENDTVQRVGFDYCFMANEEEANMPIMVVKDEKTKVLFAHAVPEKAKMTGYEIDRMVEDIDLLGHGKVIIKCDQESHLEVVRAGVMKERGQDVTIPENSPVKSSASNGMIESGVRAVECQIRTMNMALENRLGFKISMHAPVTSL